MSTAATIAAPPSPYKGLSPFDDSPLDALLFFGRSRETEIVAANVLASRLTVLYGPSGVGKSSLLRAGVVRSLRTAPEPAPAVVVYGSWAGDALAGLEDAARAAVADAIGREPADAPGGPADRLAAWTAELGAELCLLLDQLEELFLYHRPETGAGGFVDLLPELVTRPGLQVNVLLGIRDDALAQLDVFKQRLPGLFANSLRLDHLDEEAARGAIIGPLERYNELVGAGARIDIEPALVAAVLAEVETGRIEKGLGGRGGAETAAPQAGRIETPYLQLVMQRIWEVERERGSSVLRLETLRGLGGAERIVESHLERALAALTPAQQDAAAGVFGHLVTPSGTKVAHGVTDLASYAAVAATDLEPVLRSLSHERILRPLGENGHAAGDRYEIFHDVLAGAVLAWRTRHDADAALARERETSRRRHRLLLAVIAASLVALAAMTALTVYAFSQRSEANEQAALATAAADEAANQQAQADRLRREAQQAARDAEEQRAVAEEAEKEARAAAATSAQARAQATVDARRAKAAEADAKEQANLAEQSEGDAIASEQRARRAQTRAEESEQNARRAAEAEVRQKTRAEVERNRAVRQEKRATARARAQEAFALLTVDPQQSLKLALNAADLIEDDVLTEDSLRRALVASRVRLVLTANARIRAAHFSPDSRRLVAASDDGAARLYRISGDRRRLVRALRHDASVFDASFDPTGNHVVTAGHDRRAAIWSGQTGALEAWLPHKGIVWNASFSMDGQLVVTASEDGTVQIWRRDGSRVRTLDVDGAALSARFSPDATMVAAVVRAREGRRTARVFDIGSGNTVFAPDQRGIQAVAFSPDSQVLATASSDRTTKLWNVRSREPLQTLDQPEGWIVDAEFSPNGRLIATASQGGTVGLWNVASGVRVHLLCCPDNFVQSVSFNPDGRFVVAASRDRTARVFEVSTGRQTMLLAGHEDSVLAAEFSPNGRRVVTASSDGTARVWDPGTVDQLEFLGRHTRAARTSTFSPDGASVLSAGDDGFARLWPGAGGRELRSFRHGRQVVSSAFSPDGTLVATASPADGTARVFLASNGRELVPIQGSRPERVLFSPDSRLLLVTEAAGPARLWNPRTGRPVAPLANTRRITAAAFSRDGSLLVAGQADGKVGVFDARTGALRRPIEGHEGDVVAVSFSPDRRWVLTAGEDASARVWNARTGRLAHVLKGHEGPLTDADYNHTGTLVLTASVDNDARVWDARTGELVHTLRAHFGTVTSASFSRDDRWIVTAGPTTAGLWLARTGQLLSFLRGPASTVTSAAFAPRGHRVVASSVDGTVRVFRCDVCGGLDQLRALARVRLARASGR
jgi:WD40 repeat protein